MIDQFHGGTISEPKAAKEPEVKVEPTAVPAAPVVTPEPIAEVAPRVQMQQVQQTSMVPPEVAAAPAMPAPPLPVPDTAMAEPVARVQMQQVQQTSMASPVAAMPAPDLPPATTAIPATAIAQANNAPPQNTSEITASDEAQLRSQDQPQQETQDANQEEEAFEAASQMIAKGLGVEQALQQMAQLPEPVKQKVRARLQQMAIAKEQREHEMAQQTREKSQSKGFKLFSLAAMSGLISQKTIEKVQMLFTQQPHLQQQIQMTGQALLKAGAMPDMEFAKSNVQIVGPAQSTPAIGQEQEQNPQR